MVVIVSRTLSWASVVSVLQELNSCHHPRVTDWVVWWLKLKIEKSWLLKQNRNLCFLSHYWLLLALTPKECVAGELYGAGERSLRITSGSWYSCFAFHLVILNERDPQVCWKKKIILILYRAIYNQ